MLIYLFIITIVYEAARIVRDIASYRSMKRANEEKAPEDPARVSPENFDLAFGIALSSKSSIGVSPSASLSYVLSLFLPLSMGTFTMIVNALFVVVQILLLRKNFKLINLLQLVITLVNWNDYYLNWS